MFILDKKKIAAGICILIFVFGILGQFMYSARDAITALNSTVYPGQRISTGGDNIFGKLFTKPTDIFMPYMNTSTNTNVCEQSGFTNYGILCIAVFPYLALKLKRKRSILPGYAFALCAIVIGIFCIFGFPQWLAKITLFSYIIRPLLVFSFISAIYTIWTIGLYFDNKVDLSKGLLCILTFILAVISTCYTESSVDVRYTEQLGLILLWSINFIFNMLPVLLWVSFNDIFFYSLFVWILLSSMTVNPVVTGINAVTDINLARISVNANDDNPGRWLVGGDGYSRSLLVANGIQVVNGTDFYPDVEKWERLGIWTTDNNSVNRYLNLMAALTEGDTYIQLLQDDAAVLHINPEDLDLLEVSYILGNDNDIAILENSNVDFTILNTDRFSGLSVITIH